MISKNYNEIYNLKEAPLIFNKPEKKENIYYNCTECSSLIEILSINENIIDFKCLNKDNIHKKQIMTIKNYIEKMVKYNNIKVNKDTCETHKDNKYISFCFKCKCHLCEECLKTRTHIFHNKNNIIEVQPIKEELDIILKIIEDYRERIEKLEFDKEKEIKKLNNKFNKNELKEKKKKKK